MANVRQFCFTFMSMKTCAGFHAFLPGFSRSGLISGYLDWSDSYIRIAFAIGAQKNSP